MIYYLTSGVFCYAKGVPNETIYTPEFKKLVIETHAGREMSYS